MLNDAGVIVTVAALALVVIRILGRVPRCNIELTPETPGTPTDLAA